MAFVLIITVPKISPWRVRLLIRMRLRRRRSRLRVLRVCSAPAGAVTREKCLVSATMPFIMVVVTGRELSRTECGSFG